MFKREQFQTLKFQRVVVTQTFRELVGLKKTFITLIIYFEKSYFLRALQCFC